jgi:hypothetical protein
LADLEIAPGVFVDTAALPPIPDRPADRTYRFSLYNEPPSAPEFVRILEEAGFVFDRTTYPIQLRWPKRASINEAEGYALYEQWDTLNG